MEIRTEPMTWQQLKLKLEKTFMPMEMERLEKAYQFSERAHEGQTRLSGDPYVVHCIETAGILYDLHSDTDAIVAGLLHDCIEDTSATYEDIVREFGKDVADLVEGVTKISTRVFRDSEEQKAENLRKIMLAMIRDIRVLVIKLADRLHNMRTLEHLAVDKQKRLARETMEIYAPLAHRLGISRLKNELEDAAFRFLYVEEYSELISKVTGFETQHADIIEEAKKDIEKLLADMSIKAEVSGRRKHLFSIWNKMRYQKKTLDQIYDLLALRIIVPALRDCYAALGTVHAHWKPMPGRFKDFIAMPRSNMYQSLHTTVIGPSGEPLEIQIRTEEMHQTAEEGIAAHWTYKEGVEVGEKISNKFSWFRQFLDWQQDLRDSKEFMEALKIDLFEDEVFVFTPKGEVKSLRRNANPIDFAYLIHSRIGDTLMGAKVNGRLVPLKYELKNGDIVEVITRSDARPSRDWLKIVRTTKAKNRIRHYFRQLEKDDNIKQGKALLSAELERCEVSLAEVLKKERLLDVGRKMNFKSVDELLIQVGDGNITARTVAAKLGLDVPNTQPPVQPVPTETRKESKNDDSIRVHGLAGMVTRFAQCCHPIPGDSIVGYITQGRGVSVHRADCSNALGLLEESGRRVDVTWDEMQKGVTHILQLYVQALDRERLQTDLLQIFDESGAVLKETSTRTNKNNIFEGTYKVQVKGKDHVKELIRDLNKVKDVQKVSRQ
jgi:GTP diphosphokinase / guanosine-3',5'-bis(diphosphate) 3'-diphosphatase